MLQKRPTSFTPRRAPALRGGQKATSLVKVRLTEAEAEALRRAGKPLSVLLREAAEALLAQQEEDLFRSRLVVMEQTLEGIAMATAKLHTRVGELYAQARAHEQEGIAREAELGRTVTHVSAQIAAVDQRQRIHVALSGAAAYAAGNPKELAQFALRIEQLGKDPASDPALKLVEYLATLGAKHRAEAGPARAAE